MARRFSMVSKNPHETRRMAADLGVCAEPGLVVGLSGRLGAGKTVFVRGLGEGLGMADAREVASPTYLLIHEYEARLPLYHFDSYRLSDPAHFGELGVEEYFDGPGVSVVEWSDKVTEWLPSSRLDVLIADVVLNEAASPERGEAARLITACVVGPAWQNLFDAWLSRIKSWLDVDAEQSLLVEE